MKGIQGANRGFTLVELLVVIMIIGTLASLIVPVVGSAYERIYRAKCQHQLGQLGKLAFLYAEDHHGRLPVATDVEQPRAYESFQLMIDTMEEARRPELYVCPASMQKAAVRDRRTGRLELTEDSVSYAWRTDRTDIRRASADLIVACDRGVADGSVEFAEYHRGGMNLLEPDGSVHWRTLEDLLLRSPRDVEEFLETAGLTD